MSQHSHSPNEQACDHVSRLDIARSTPSLSLASQSPPSPVIHIQDSIPPDVFQLTGDPNPNHLPNGLTAQMFFFLACTVIGVQGNFLTSSTPPLTPLTRVLTILGLILELSGAVLVGSNIQPQPQSVDGARTRRQASQEDAIKQTLSIALILTGIAVFTAAVILTMFSIKPS